MSRLTVAETILADLARARGWVCDGAFYASYRPTFSQRVSELNAATPGRIVSRVCQRDGHDHRGTIHEYALREYASPEQRMIEWRKGKYRRTDSYETKWHRIVNGRAVCGSPKPQDVTDRFKSDSLYPGEVCEKCDAAR